MKKLIAAALIVLGGAATNAQQLSFPGSNLKLFKTPANVKTHTLGTSFGVIQFVDHATSPLIYIGPNGGLNYGRAYYRDGWSYGAQLGVVGFGATPYTGSSSSLSTGAIFDLDAWAKFGVFRYENLQVNAGPMITGNSTVRLNPALQNNQLGFEEFRSLMAKTEVIFAWNREEAVTKGWWIFNRVLPPVKRDLTLGINIGLVNYNYRNGFSYIGQSVLINDFVPGDGYEHTYAGSRLELYISKTRWTPSGNGLEWSYNFTGFNTGRDQELFGLTQHNIGFTYHIKTN